VADSFTYDSRIFRSPQYRTTRHISFCSACIFFCERDGYWSAVCTAVTCCTVRRVASTTSTRGRISKLRSGFVGAGSVKSAKPAKTVASQVWMPVFRIRIHLMRIRIQHFRMNTIYLSLGLHKGRSSYRRSTSKHEIFQFFYIFVVHFCPPEVFIISLFYTRIGFISIPSS
jgi:hypothetical protein